MELLQLNFKFSSRFPGAEKEKKAHFLIWGAYWALSTGNGATAQNIDFYLQTAQPLLSHPLTHLLIAPTLKGFKTWLGHTGRELQLNKAASRGVHAPEPPASRGWDKGEQCPRPVQSMALDDKPVGRRLVT